MGLGPDLVVRVGPRRSTKEAIVGKKIGKAWCCGFWEHRQGSGEVAESMEATAATRYHLNDEEHKKDEGLPLTLPLMNLSSSLSNKLPVLVESTLVATLLLSTCC